jgi:hypothetical protein
MARRRAGDEESGHVRRRDQQQQADGDEQEDDRRPDIRHEIVAQRRQLDANVLVVVRVVALERHRQRVHVSLRTLG